MITVCVRNINTMFGKNVEEVTVKAGGSYRLLQPRTRQSHFHHHVSLKSNTNNLSFVHISRSIVHSISCFFQYWRAFKLWTTIDSVLARNCVQKKIRFRFAVLVFCLLSWSYLPTLLLWPSQLYILVLRPMGVTLTNSSFRYGNAWDTNEAYCLSLVIPVNNFVLRTSTGLKVVFILRACFSCMIFYACTWVTWHNVNWPRWIQSLHTWCLFERMEKCPGRT